MKNFKIKDLMISVHPNSCPKGGYSDDRLKSGTITLEANCIAASNCSATKAAPHCSSSKPTPQCSATRRPECSATKPTPECSATRSPECSATKPPPNPGKNAFINNEMEMKHAEDLLNLKQTLAVMQANKNSRNI